MTSRETRWLQQDHAAAARDLKAHRATCPACTKAARRRGEGPCPQGAELVQRAGQLQQQARAAVAADRLPIPGQLALDLDGPDPERLVMP